MAALVKPVTSTAPRNTRSASRPEVVGHVRQLPGDAVLAGQRLAEDDDRGDKDRDTDRGEEEEQAAPVGDRGELPADDGTDDGRQPGEHGQLAVVPHQSAGPWRSDRRSSAGPARPPMRGRPPVHASLPCGGLSWSPPVGVRERGRHAGFLPCAAGAARPSSAERGGRRRRWVYGWSRALMARRPSMAS